LAIFVQFGGNILGTSETMEDRQAKVNDAMSKVRHKIAVMSGKGGVGKSTVAANLSLSLQLKGQRVGLLDADIHGPTIPKMLGIEDVKLGVMEGGIAPAMVPSGLKVVSMGFLLQDRDTPVIWRGPMKMGAISQFLGEVAWGELDFLVVDLPPGTGDEPLSIAQLIPAMDGSLIVTTPQEVALTSVRKCINFSKTLGIPVLGIIENMSGFVCPHCGKKIEVFGSGGGEAAARELSVPFLGRIPLEPEIVRSGESGTPFVLNEEKSPSVAEFDSIVSKLAEGMGESLEG
jgi:ATP-binding protein involved in chromosome partitioning